MREVAVFVPGALCDRRLFVHQLDHLADVAEARCVEPPDLATVDAMAEAILADAPERFALCGLSLGGIVALEIVRRAPERVGRLALTATTAEPDPPPLTAIRRTSVERVRTGGFEPQVETVLPLLLGPHGRERQDVAATARSMAFGVGAERYARQLEAITNRPDQRALPGAITCPTLVLCGRDDAVITVDAHATLARAIPAARLAVVEQAGHLVPLEQPAATTALLRDWLLYGV